MRNGDKVNKSISKRKGSSMIFVLGVMLLLMSIGSSVLVAVGTSPGTLANRKTSDQMTLYADSINKTILYSLQTAEKNSINGGDKGSVLDEAKTLGGQILKYVYNNQDKNTISLDLTASFGDSTDISQIKEIKIEFKPITKVIDEIPAQDEVVSGGIVVSAAKPRQPKSATISSSGEVLISVTIEHEGKKLKTMSRLSFTGGYMQDNGNVDTMIIENPGEWRLLSYDKIDI